MSAHDPKDGGSGGAELLPIVLLILLGLAATQGGHVAQALVHEAHTTWPFVDLPFKGIRWLLRALVGGP